MVVEKMASPCFYIFAFCSLTNRQNIYIIDAYTFMRGKFTDKNLTQQTDGQNIYRIDAHICEEYAHKN